MSGLRPPPSFDIQVHITRLYEHGRATYLSGHFDFKGQKFAFDAIAMEGYGGPNVGATLPDGTINELQRLGLAYDDIDELVVTLQRMIMEGQAKIEIPADESGGGGSAKSREVTKS